MTRKNAAAKKTANSNLSAKTAGLAVYAADPTHSRGRLLPEPPPSNRSEFQRDRDRIVHSGAFRKLEYKTQVFVNHEGDYYRTRLTHSLEVAQITRAIARALNLNEDLAEACALAHDLGHTPFGHAGEDALNEVMDAFGGFNHNDQTLRVLTRLESRYAKFDGLNLTWETLEGVVKHNGPLPKKKFPPSIAAYNRQHDLELSTYASAEAQVAALADDIAYNNHDIDDGLRAGLFTLDDLAAVPLCANALRQLRKTYPDLEQGRLIAELVRDLIGQLVGDVLAETRRRIAQLKPQSADDIRAHHQPVVAFSAAMQASLKDLKEFLMQRMYRHYRVNRMTSKARRVVRELFMILLAEPECLPGDWQEKMLGLDEKPRARIIADYIAGMTDRYALDEHRRLFDLYARS
jgi:dGTPase